MHEQADFTLPNEPFPEAYEKWREAVNNLDLSGLEGGDKSSELFYRLSQKIMANQGMLRLAFNTVTELRLHERMWRNVARADHQSVADGAAHFTLLALFEKGIMQTYLDEDGNICITYEAFEALMEQVAYLSLVMTLSYLLNGGDMPLSAQMDFVRRRLERITNGKSVKGNLDMLIYAIESLLASLNSELKEMEDDEPF